MKRSWWRTGPPLQHTQPMIGPTVGQLLRQIGVLLVIAALWGGGLLVLLGATRSSNVAFVAEQGTPERKAIGLGAIDTPTVTTSSAATAAVATHPPTARATVPRAVDATAATPATATATPVATNTPTLEAVVATSSPTGTAATSISFVRDVQPIFNQICVKCHGGDEVKEGLNLTSYAEVMLGSNNGAVIVPGDPANSLLVQQVENGKMPKRGPKLLPKQIQAIVAWIAAGAPDN